MRVSIIICIATMLLAHMDALAHPGHLEGEGVQGAPEDTAIREFTLALNVNAEVADSDATSGQGDLKFRLLYTSDLLPGLVASVLEQAHGGFAVDRREGRGEIYFALPEAGIIQIGRDFKMIRMLNSPREIRATNMHDTAIWYDEKGNGYLTFPANNVGKVYTTTMDGMMKSTLDAPSADLSFSAEKVGAYFKEGGAFVPTDVEYIDGTFFVTTGYSELDFVLTAGVSITDPPPAPAGGGRRRGFGRRGPQGPNVSATWNSLAFGGKGEGPGEFGTGHGITLEPNGETLAVADRPNSEIERYSLSGKHLGKISLPEGAWPCDIDYEAGYAVVGCFHGPNRSKGAPIYLLKDDKVVSTIMPKEDLGLEKFQHVHNAVIVQREGRLYIVAQAWNPGDFAILEQVTN